MTGSDGIFYDGHQVYDTEIKDTGFLIAPLIPKEGITLVFGKYSSYKTPFTLNIAKAVATGSTLWDLPVESGKVLFIEGDTPKPGIWPRLKLLDTRVDNMHFAFVYPGVDFVNPDGGGLRNKQVCKLLKDKHEHEGYKFVVIDSLRTSHNLVSKDSEAPPRVYRSFASMFPGASVMVIHHDRKTRPVETRGHKQRTQEEEELEHESFSGSQAWVDLATSGIKLTKGFGVDKGWLTVTQTKCQIGKGLDPFQLRVDDDAIGFAPAKVIDETMIANALAVVTVNAKFRNYKQLDAAIADFYQTGTSVARIARIKYEEMTGASLL